MKESPLLRGRRATTSTPVGGLSHSCSLAAPLQSVLEVGLPFY